MQSSTHQWSPTAMMHYTVHLPCFLVGHDRLDWFTLCRPPCHPGEAGCSSSLHRAIDSIKVRTLLPVRALSMNTYLRASVSQSHLPLRLPCADIPWCLPLNLCLSLRPRSTLSHSSHDSLCLALLSLFSLEQKCGVINKIVYSLTTLGKMVGRIKSSNLNGILLPVLIVCLFYSDEETALNAYA